MAALAPVSGKGPRHADAQEKKRKVIFVVHDLNPFFVPAIVGLKDFGALAGWKTEFIGPPVKAMKFSALNLYQLFLLIVCRH